MYKVKVSSCSTMMQFCKERCSKFVLHLSLLVLPFVYSLYADSIELVKDINVIPSPDSSICSTPTYTNSLLFFCGASSNGEELWVSNDTPEGTLMIKDINTGIPSSSPRNLVNLNGVAYFLANDGTSGDQLWRSDGTSSGTSVVKDLSNEGYIVEDLLVFNGELLLFAKSFGSSSTSNTYGKVWKSDGTELGTISLKYLSDAGQFNQFTAINNVLYFVVNDFGGSTNLWKTNGSSAGTQLVKRFAGVNNVVSSPLNHLIEVNGMLFFSAEDSVTGVELWKSDGTNQGTVLVKDINTTDFPRWSSPYDLNNVNGTLFFTAKNSSGRELWKSDGTEEGTLLVKDINPGTGSSTSNGTKDSVVLNGTLYFSAFNGTSTSFWKSDGTEGGTSVVKSFDSIVEIQQFEVSSGQIYFVLADHTNNTDSLWKSDGSTLGTVLLKSATYNSLGLITDINGSIQFSMDDGINGSELWTSNGTELGTILVKNINTGGASSNPATFPITYPVTSLSINNFNRFFVIGNSSYFTADDGNNGRELWKSDGTNAGTFMIKNISDKSVSSNPELLTNVTGTLFFKADSDKSPESDGLSYQVQELWKSDGTLEGTKLVKDIISSSPYRSIEFLTESNEVLYFSAVDDAHGRELWKSDGTEGGTVIVKDISTGASSSYPINLTSVNNLLYFTTSSLDGFKLWKTDGTESGTVEVHEPTNIENLRNMQNTLYFTAGYWNQFGSSNEYYELWKSDGTNLSTVKVAGGFTSPITNMTEVNGTIYFIAGDINTNRALWKTNGSGASLVAVVGFSSDNVSNMVSYNGQLFFATKELWKTDGTEVGTEMVKDINNNFNSDPRGLKVVNGELYFTAHENSHGRELWKTNGTLEGTELIKDIYSGSDPSLITNMTENNGVLYFFADDGVHGSQLWKSDGSNTDTVQLTNSLSSGLRELKAFGNNLFLSASTDQYGKELWVFSGGNDSDADGIDDAIDNCPAVANADQLNTDGDSQGNVCDDDDDGDGILDDQDSFPLDASESIDTDSDGIGNNADLDDDNDLIPDDWEIDNGLNPLDASDASLDSDLDGVSNHDEYLAGTNPNNQIFTWDIDGDGDVRPLTDGLLNLRYHFGFRGETLIDRAIGTNATRISAAEIESYFEGGLEKMDIDGDDDTKPLTDGLLLLRYLFGFRGDILMNGAFEQTGTRNTAEKVEAYIDGLIE